jgi:hypothetical protein
MSKATKVLEMTPHQAARKIAPIFAKKGWTWGFTDAKGGFRTPTEFEIEEAIKELVSYPLHTGWFCETGRLRVTSRKEGLFLSIRGTFKAKLKGLQEQKVGGESS